MNKLHFSNSKLITFDRIDTASYDNDWYLGVGNIDEITTVWKSIKYFFDFPVEKICSYHKNQWDGLNWKIIDWFLFDETNWYRYSLCIDDTFCKSKQTIITDPSGKSWHIYLSEIFSRRPLRFFQYLFLNRNLTCWH